jgi:hypothetical protein
VVLAALVAFAFPFAANADDSLMCRNSLVTVGMAPAEILAKCGEPKAKAVETRPVYARTPAGGRVQTGTYSVERWTYDRGYGRFPAVLTFEDGALKSIELLTRR